MQQNNFINIESPDKQIPISATVRAFLVFGIVPTPLDLGPISTTGFPSKQLVMPETVIPSFVTPETSKEIHP